MNKELKQGQRVEFRIGDLTGTGKIVGKAFNEYEHMFYRKKRYTGSKKYIAKVKRQF